MRRAPSRDSVNALAVGRPRSAIRPDGEVELRRPDLVLGPVEPVLHERPDRDAADLERIRLEVQAYVLVLGVRTLRAKLDAAPVEPQLARLKERGSVLDVSRAKLRMSGASGRRSVVGW